MSMTNVSSLNHTVQQTQEWLKELVEIGHYENESEAYSALRGVLQALRDRLTVDEAAHLAAGFPMLIRGFYYEGWKPASMPVDLSTAEEFHGHVKKRLGEQSDIDPFHATRSVLRLLSSRVPAGEVEDVQQMLPEEIRTLWEDADD